MRVIQLAITTDADGAATVTGSEFCTGWLYGLRYVPGTIATGGDLTISWTLGSNAQTILTITNAGTSDVSWYPRSSSCGATGTSNSDNLIMVPFFGLPKVVVAQGGNGGAGSLYFYILETE